jgi:hypothetical protein
MPPNSCKYGSLFVSRGGTEQVTIPLIADFIALLNSVNTNKKPILTTRMASLQERVSWVELVGTKKYRTGEYHA